MQANYVQRLRLTFSKDGPTRYIGHLDLARTLERSLNRATIPLAYTQGYNRQPRMQFASALPLGFTSTCEMVDIWLVEEIDPELAHRQIMAKIAPGITVHRVKAVPLSGRPLQTQVAAAVYGVILLDPIDEDSLQADIVAFLAAGSIMRERRGKQYDLRPLVFELTYQPAGGDKLGQLNMRLSLLPGKTGRPDEVLKSLGIDPLASHIQRRKLILADALSATE